MTTFVLRTAIASGDEVGEGGNGVLQNAKGKFYTPVILPTAGVNICRFSMAFRDFDAGKINARLFKKTYVTGGVAFAPPILMAKLETTGSVDTVRRRTTGTIAQPTVSTVVELEISTTQLQVLGVELIVQPTCP